MGKARIIVNATGLLDEAEARAAEAEVLDRTGRLTPGGLRAAIARAVMEVNPEKARRRREHAARLARVQRWAESSGNAGLTGRELPPAEVLAADQRITAWAHELREAGLEGSMDELRAEVSKMRADLWDAVSEGKLSLPIDRVFKLDDAEAAQAHMRTNAHFGKIVMVP